MTAADLKLAGDVLVSRRGDIAQVFIDGEEFPWFTDRRSIGVMVDPDGWSTIEVTLLAERVTVLDDGIDSATERVEAPVRMTGAEAVEHLTAQREEDRRALVFATDRAENAERDLRWARRSNQLLSLLLLRRQEQLDTAHAAIAQRDHEIARLDPELVPLVRSPQETA